MLLEIQPLLRVLDLIEGVAARDFHQLFLLFALDGLLLLVGEGDALDVYKRQVWRQSVRRDQGAVGRKMQKTAFMRTPFLVAVSAVSYTHLDVYKRQQIKS